MTTDGRNAYADERDQYEMKSKHTATVQAVHEAECDAVILSAFGCGAFKTYPEMVSSMFKEQLDMFPIKHVTFCIFDDHDAGKAHNPDGHVQPFKRNLGC